MKKSKLMKSLMNAGTIGIAGMGASVGIASCTPENAETLNINGGGDINGRIGQSITTEKLDCTTATGSLVSDAFFSVSNLPAGLTIDSGTGIISGTPTKLESGEYTIVVTSAQHPKANGKINEPFQIGPVVPKSLIISGEQDINGNVNAPITTYKLNCQTDTGAVVGDAIYNMDPSTPLPNNLEINSDTGVISGIPTAEAATNTYTINVISNTYPGLSGSVNIDITIGAQIPKSLDIIGAVNITGNVNTQITNTSSLSCLTDTGASVENVFYSVLDLPNDLQIDPSSGIISGIPKTEGSGTYTINATADGLSGTIVKSYSISNPLPTDLVIVGAENINGNVNTAITAAPLYCQTNTGAVVGDAVYTILNKPSWLNITSNNGVGIISGTPTAEVATNTYTINVASNTYPGLSGSVNMDITIGPEIPKSLTIEGAPTGTIFGNVALAVSQISLTCKTNTGIAVTDAQYSVSNLPAGVSITSNDGVGIISGTPTAEAEITCTITVTSAMYGLFDNSTTINFKISPAHTLLISPAKLASDTVLRTACNLQINPTTSELSKINDWDETRNSLFNSYISSLTALQPTAIQFEDIASVAAETLNDCTQLSSSTGQITSIQFANINNTHDNPLNIKASVFEACTGLRKVEFKPSQPGNTPFITLATNAFRDCSALDDIDLSNVSVVSTGAYIFWGCTKLSTINLSASTYLTSIVNWAFQESYLETIQLPNALTTIAPSGFYLAHNLKQIDLSNTQVTSLGNSCFSSCPKLENISFPLSMFNTSATIGEKILNSCTSLNKIYIPITATQIPTINSNAFQGCPNTSSCTIYAPSIDLGNAFKAAANNYLNNWTVEVYTGS